MKYYINIYNIFWNIIAIEIIYDKLKFTMQIIFIVYCRWIDNIVTVQRLYFRLMKSYNLAFKYYFVINTSINTV